VSPADGAASRRTPEENSFDEKGSCVITLAAQIWIIPTAPLDCFSASSVPI
jgi:hypothetical protein